MFSDAQYELAKVISKLPIDVRNRHTSYEDLLSLTHDQRFCVTFEEGCATWVRDVKCSTKHTSDIINLAKTTLFAVKTCKKHHKERLPIIRQTWAKAALNIEYFSEVVNKKYQTRVLPEVYKNTEKGHCQKTEGILKYFNKNANMKGWKWLVIVDDDTILGVQKMLSLLECYDPKDTIVIGQRYGFMLSEERIGYDFLGGGAGMVFSRGMVTEILKDNGKQCTCPKPEEHDDMYFTGVCVASLKGSIIHSDQFHQNSPSDYAPELLQHQDPISFHKFEHIDEEFGILVSTNPLETYDKYFRDSDEYLRNYKHNKGKHDDEL